MLWVKKGVGSCACMTSPLVPRPTCIKTDCRVLRSEQARCTCALTQTCLTSAPLGLPNVVTKVLGRGNRPTIGQVGDSDRLAECGSEAHGMMQSHHSAPPIGQIRKCAPYRHRDGKVTRADSYPYRTPDGPTSGVPSSTAGAAFPSVLFLPRVPN
jgi:hypothetical protein